MHGGTSSARACSACGKRPAPSSTAPGPVRDADAIAAVGAAMDTAMTRLRDAMNAVADDLVTGDVLIEIARDLESLAWVIRAHGQ